jgi:hypothetical protein
MIKSGVNIRISANDPFKRPIPKKTAYMPNIMGLRLKEYGPLITNSCGGLIGTGVPRALMNKIIVHSHKAAPGISRMRPATSVHGTQIIEGRFSHLSVANDATKNSAKKQTNRDPIIGVNIQRFLSPPLAMLNKEFAILSNMLIIYLCLSFMDMVILSFPLVIYNQHETHYLRID